MASEQAGAPAASGYVVLREVEAGRWIVIGDVDRRLGPDGAELANASSQRLHRPGASRGRGLCGAAAQRMAGGPAVLELLSGGVCVHADSCPGGTSFVSHAIGGNTTNRIRLCDPTLVRCRHGVGYRRSPGNMTSRRLTQSAEVVCRRGQRWWSVLSSWPSPTQAHGSRLVGHSSTTTTETIYRKQICPVIVHGADIMHRIFPGGADHDA